MFYYQDVHLVITAIHWRMAAAVSPATVTTTTTTTTGPCVTIVLEVKKMFQFVQFLKIQYLKKLIVHFIFKVWFLDNNLPNPPEY